MRNMLEIRSGVISDINKEHNLKISLNLRVSAFLQKNKIELDFQDSFYF